MLQLIVSVGDAVKYAVDLRVSTLHISLVQDWMDTGLVKIC